MNPDESSYNTRNNIRNDFLQTFSVYRHWRSFGLRARTEKQTCGTSHLYDRITIRNNIFTITSDSEQIDRYGILADTYGSFIDPTGAESTTDFTIEGNTFDVSDPKATVLEITTNNKSPKHIKNVTIKDNTLKGVNGGKAIDLYLLDNCTISGNTIEGFERPIVANSCDEQFISDTDIVTE